MSNSAFEETFQRLTRRLMAVGSLSGLAWGGFGALVLLLLGMWVDLVWDLSSVARVAAVTLAVVAGAALLGWFLTQAIRFSRRSTLVRALDRTGQSGGEIVSGYELHARGGSAVAGLSQGLAEIAAARAAQLAALIPTTLVVPTKPVRQAAFAVGAMFFAFLVVALFAPGLAGTEFLRFADPYGDHPPWSLTQFQVEPGDTQIRFGDGLDVFVTVTGPVVDDLELVMRPTAAGARESFLPMFSDSIGHWRASVSSVTEPSEYFVRTRGARSHRYRIGVLTVPEIEKVRFRIVPSAYTREPVYEGPLPQGGLSALAGTQVEVRATSNRPLKAGALELTLGDKHETVSLRPASAEESSREVVGNWTVTAAGGFHLNVTDVEGQSSRDSFSGTVNLLQDHTPLVRIVDPAPQSLATPTATIPVNVAAEDDYGVTSVQLYRSLNDSRGLPLKFDLPDPPPRRHEQQIQLPLGMYGLQPGDVIKLFARVEDNDPAGAKGSESSVVVVQIVSEEELDQLVRAREGVDAILSKYQAAQRRLEALQEEVDQLRKKMEKRDPEGALSEQERQEMETLSKRMAEEAEAVREASEHVMPYDLDKSLNEELKKLSQRMQQAAEEAAEAAKSSATPGQAAEKLEQLREKLAQEKKKMKEGINDPLERLGEIFPLMEDQNRFVELYHRQRDLAERLKSLEKAENPDDPAIKSRMRDLEAEQRKVREDLDELLNDIETHAQRLPEDDPQLKKLAKQALDFVENVRASEAGTAMSDAELGLAEFSGKRGHDEAKNAADILEKFIAQSKACEKSGEGACQGLKFQPGEGAMGDTLNQLLSAAGFKPGAGGQPGQNGPMGTGGGYSARRGAMQRMGLYGRMPTRGNPTSASGQGKQGGPTIGASYTTDSNRVSASRLDPHGLLKSSGTSETAIPAQYRSRVQQYFQRIAEESGGQK